MRIGVLLSLQIHFTWDVCKMSSKYLFYKKLRVSNRTFEYFYITAPTWHNNVSNYIQIYDLTWEERYNFTSIFLACLLSWRKCERCFQTSFFCIDGNGTSKAYQATSACSVSWESTAVFFLKEGTNQGQPACPPMIFDLEHCANTLSCQCHGRLAEGLLFPWPSPLAKADK